VVIISIFWLLLFPIEDQLAGPKQNNLLFQRSFQNAVSHDSQGEFEQASLDFLKALSISRQLKYPYGQSKCLLKLAILKWDLGHIAESSEYFEKARAVFINTYDRRAEEYCIKCLKIIQLYGQGKAARDNNLNLISLEKFEQAIFLGRETGFLNYELKCLRQIGFTYWQMGRINLFLESNKKGLEISTRINHKIEKAKCLNNIGVYYQKQNDYPLALINYENALSIIETTDDQSTEAECLSNIGIVYRDLGNLSKAQQYLLSALELDNDSGDIDSISKDMNNIGSVYLRSGIDGQNTHELLRAMDMYRRCISLPSIVNTNSLLYYAALNNMGIVQSEMKDYISARKSFRRALNIVNNGNYPTEIGKVYTNIASSYLNENKINNAIEYFNKAFEIGLEHSVVNILMEACLGLGQCYEMKKEYQLAIFYYRKSIEAMESIWDLIPSEYFKIEYARNKMNAYQRIVRILVSLYRDNPHSTSIEEIFNYVERAKARAFLENIREAWEGDNTGTNASYSEKRQEISNSISILFRKMLAYGLRSEAKQQINNELEREEEKYLSLISKIQTEARDKIQNISKKICSISQLQKQIINSETVLLEYYIEEKESYLFIITKNVANICVLAGRDGLEQSLRAYIKILSFSSSDKSVGIEAAKRIYEELIPPENGGMLREAKALIIIPDGILCYLPFETLRTGLGNGSGYLVEKMEISYCPSSSSLFILKQKNKQDVVHKAILVLGGPSYEILPTNENDIPKKRMQDRLFGEHGIGFPKLPFSREEALEIGKLFKKSERTILVGENASEEAIKTLPMNEYRLIHFACHGYLDERVPFRSALVLSMYAQQKDDGYLQVREICELTLSADLVVLSACHAGSGIMERGEGPMGLARPFFYAGTRSVLASLWSINDKTSVFFMKEFYRNIISGHSVGKALQLTKIKMLHSAWANPFYWACFILNGDPTVVSIGRGGQ
jgi:CHAT domain-containing protein/Tfp pilus assembly protein PilF